MDSNFSRIRKILYWAFWLFVALFILDQQNRTRLGIALLIFGCWALILIVDLFLGSRGEKPLLLERNAFLRRFVFSRLLLNEKKFTSAKDKTVALQNLLIEANLFPKDVDNVTRWFASIQKEIKESKQFWTMKNLRRRGTLAKHWTAGYTVALDKFSTDLTEIAKVGGFPRVAGHKAELEAMERVLSKEEINNVLLVGEPGSGRKSIIFDLASKITLGESSAKLNYRRMLQLDLPSLFAQFPDPSQRGTMLDEMFKEVVNAGNIVLVVEELHNFLAITGFLTPYLKSPEFPVITTTTFAGLHQHIEQNPSLLSMLEKVEVSEISEEETLRVLEDKVFGAERKYKIFISYPALQTIVQYAGTYIQAVPFPKKALDLFDEAVTYLSQSDEKILLPKHVAKIVEQKTQIPVGELQTQEKEILLKLEEYMHKRIIDQEEAVKEVSSALRRARAEISKRKGPIGGFMFLGPTGVGKTETAKALAAIYFGAEERMIRLDMSEFQNLQDIDRLLGTPAQPGLLTTAVRENPFSLLLLDEIEKAHSNILNLFLQVLDEGHITDGLGRKVTFQHAIIIATSNAGYQLILQALKENADFTLLKDKMRDYLFANNIFRPEFLNRFDSVVLFKPLSKQHLLDIVGLMLNKLKKNLAEKGIEFVVTEPLKEKLVELGYDPLFGARPMKRVIQDKVENAFAIALLRGDITRGDRVEIDPSSFVVQRLQN
ncbi:MAG: ATP-dependent Clp protease ATP-binding subunit [Candidatus Wildermuthbacteria bacterium]|nr:ATP-dependent Clp protease ATP-binding subunit [Candidatus Wildermuthbacteria bacterium]